MRNLQLLNHLKNENNLFRITHFRGKKKVLLFFLPSLVQNLTAAAQAAFDLRFLIVNLMYDIDKYLYIFLNNTIKP